MSVRRARRCGAGMGKDSMNMDQGKGGDLIVQPIRQRSRVLECLTPISSEEDRGYAFVRCRRLQFRANVAARLGVRAGNLHRDPARDQRSAHGRQRKAWSAICRGDRWNDVKDYQLKLLAERAI